MPIGVVEQLAEALDLRVVLYSLVELGGAQLTAMLGQEAVAMQQLPHATPTDTWKEAIQFHLCSIIAGGCLVHCCFVVIVVRSLL